MSVLEGKDHAGMSHPINPPTHLARSECYLRNDESAHEKSIRIRQICGQPPALLLTKCGTCV